MCFDVECKSQHSVWPARYCYYCKKEPTTTTKLFDGCVVPSCYDCAEILKKSMQDIEGQEPNKSKEVNKRMADIPEANTGGKYLGQKQVRELGIKKITIIDEAKVVDTEYQGKITKKVQCTVKADSGEEFIWQMNKNTQNYCREKFGGDSLKWKDQSLEICVKAVGNMSPSIYPIDLSLEKVMT